MKKVGNLLLLIVIIAVFIAMNYNSLDTFVVKNVQEPEEFVQVERVIDGDTVVVNGSSMRLLGINTPEKGEKYYTEAKMYAEVLVLNKSLKVEKKGKDRYDRELVYLYDGDKNVNLEIVREGLGNYYFPDGKDMHYSEFRGAWIECIKENKNLCEVSVDKCTDCIITKQFECRKDLILYNACDFNCNMTGWSVKDEGRKKFLFEEFILKSNNQVTLTTENFGEEYVWTETGDTMFLRDEKGGLVLWKAY